VLVVHGEIDLATAPAMAGAIAALAPAAGERPVVIDVGGVTFIDSTGLKALLNALVELGNDRRLILRAVPSHFRRVLEMTTTVSLFQID
jgi:anti-anti-sigma factor